MLRLVASRARRLCTASAPGGSSSPSNGPFFGIGAVGGSLGGVIGLGGGFIIVPLLGRYAGMTTHQAVGTSSAAVVSTSLFASASLSSVDAVDVSAAAIVAASAMLGARGGARLTSRFTSEQLGRAFAWFQLCVAPMVPIKGMLARRLKADATVAADAADAADTADAAVPAADAATARGELGASRVAQLGVIGGCAGVAAGLFGIGGGGVVTPALCLLTDMPYITVLGTTLAAMMPPSIMSAATHHRLGNLQPHAVLPLCAGSAVGALCGTQFAANGPSEIVLQLLFAGLVGGMGAQKLLSLRRASRGR